MTNLLEDLATLSTVSITNLTALSSMSEAIVCHGLLESIKDCEEFAEIDIGIGTLCVKNSSDGVKYKFVPSDHLSSVVDSTVRTKKSPLSLRVDEVLGKRIMNTYKDLF